MDNSALGNDMSAVIEADRAHLWHHLIQHKPFETIDPRIIVAENREHPRPRPSSAWDDRFHMRAAAACASPSAESDGREFGRLHIVSRHLRDSDD